MASPERTPAPPEAPDAAAGPGPATAGPGAGTDASPDATPGPVPCGPRIAPLAPRDWPGAMREALAALRPPGARLAAPRTEGRPKALNALGTLAHHPELTRAFHTFNGHILATSTLTERQRELLVLRVAAVRRCEYEWRQHAVLAIDVGIGPDELARVAEGPSAPGWEPLERALLAAVDELVADAVIGDATWAVLAAQLSTQQCMDVVFTVGAYDLLAMAFRSFGIQVDEDLAHAPGAGIGPAAAADPHAPGAARSAGAGASGG